MNSTISGKNSTAERIDTDCSSLQFITDSESWKKTTQQPNHNNSTNKLNVRSSLNKTNQNLTYSNQNIDNLRRSSFIVNPLSTYQHLKKQSFNQDKYNKLSKEANEMSFEVNSKDSFYKYSKVAPNSLVGEQDSKKKQSTILRGSFQEPSIVRLQEDKHIARQNKFLDEIRSQLTALSKRVLKNEQEICRLKQKKQKDKKVKSIEEQYSQFQILMFEFLKKNSNFFTDLESKIQKNSNLINEAWDKLCNSNLKEQLQEKLNSFEARIDELTELLKTKDESKAIASFFSSHQTQIKEIINNHIDEIKRRLDKNAEETNEILSKLSKINEKSKQKDNTITEYFKDTRKSINSIIVQNKQVLLVRDDMMRDTTKHHINFQIVDKKDFNDHSSKYGTPCKQNRQNVGEIKREIVMKEKIYYVDSEGYLLDENKFYLLNFKNQQIMIPDHLFKFLCKNNIIVSPPSASLTQSLLTRR